MNRRVKEQLPLKWLMGPSRKMEKVVQQIKQVADSPLTLLIQGETGTGKELVARATHQLSARRKKAFVAVDCGAIPDTLIESELFGYEKGAFTGAQQRKDGQFLMPPRREVVGIEDDQHVGVHRVDVLTYATEELRELAIGVLPHGQGRCRHVRDSKGAYQLSHA